jgi:hypothetical protein
MSKKLIIITIIIASLILSFVLFFIMKPTKLNEQILSTNTDTSIIMKGQVYEYTWIKSFDNYDYAHCHIGGYVFKSENSTNDFEYNIQFNDDININEYKNKTITIKGDKVIEKKEIDMNCDEISQRPAGICENSDTAIFTCKKIINAVIIE